MTTDTTAAGPGAGPDAGPEGPQRLLALARGLLAGARAGEQVEVVLGRSSRVSVKVYDGDVESFTSAASAGAGVRVISEGRQGFASCGSHDADVLAETLAEARDNCAFGEPDEHAGVAEPDGVAVVAQDPWSDAVLAFPTEAKIALALDLERRVRGVDPRVTGARATSFSDGWSEVALASTAGIGVAERQSSCSASTQPLARDGDETQIGWSYDVTRDPAELDLDRLAAEAVDRAVRLLGATKPASARMAILLEPRLADTLLGLVAGMLCGDAVLKGRSPFGERLGEQIASPLITLRDDPTRSESIAATATDGEGLACRPNDLIVDGVLRGFLHDAYTGRRSGAGSTGSAVRATRGLPSPGPQLQVVEPGTRSFEELVGSIDHGLYVASFAGLHSGVNATSGDFSVGADGLMIRGGELAEPVRELTIASTIQRLLLDVREVGGDAEWLPGGDRAASLVIDDVSVSGS